MPPSPGSAPPRLDPCRICASRHWEPSSPPDPGLHFVAGVESTGSSASAPDSRRSGGIRRLLRRPTPPSSIHTRLLCAGSVGGSSSMSPPSLLCADPSPAVRSSSTPPRLNRIWRPRLCHHLLLVGGSSSTPLPSLLRADYPSGRLLPGAAFASASGPLLPDPHRLCLLAPGSVPPPGPDPPSSSGARRIWSSSTPSSPLGPSSAPDQRRPELLHAEARRAVVRRPA